MTESEGPVASVVEVPLYEVTAELRFPGDARIPAWRGELQQAIRAEYPKLYVPQAKAGEAPAMQHYRFSNEAGTKSVDVAIHSLALVSREYPGWGTFRAEAISLWSRLRDALQPQRATRLGLRYVNRFAAMPSLSPGHRALYGVLGDAPRYHRGVTVVDAKGIALIVNLEVPESGSPVTVDFDAFRVDLPVAEVESALDALHATVEAEFVTIAGADLASRLGIVQGG